PWLVAVGLTGYGVVTVISTLASEFQWIGRYYILFFWSVLGFFLTAMCVGSWRRSAEVFVRYLAIQLLTVNLIGFFMFDFTGSGSGVDWLCAKVFPSGSSADGSVQVYRLLNTLSNADGNMQATILNRDFYAA